MKNARPVSPARIAAVQRRVMSDSAVQRKAEAVIRRLAGEQLGVALHPKRFALVAGGCHCDVDGYGETDDTIVLVEVWAHVGPAKSAQCNKIRADLLKLALLRHSFADAGNRRGVRCYFATLDHEAAADFEDDSWTAAAARMVGVQSLVVRVDPDLRAAVLVAQQQQDLRDLVQEIADSADADTSV